MTFFGVNLTDCPDNGDSKDCLVLTDRAEALKMLKTRKGARFKQFDTREEAERFAAEENKESKASIGETKAKPEEGCPFKGERKDERHATQFSLYVNSANYPLQA